MTQLGELRSRVLAKQRLLQSQIEDGLARDVPESTVLAWREELRQLEHYLQNGWDNLNEEQIKNLHLWLQ